MKITAFLAALALLATFSSLRAGDEAKAKPYALTTCLVAGEKLGEMGEPVVTIYEGQEIKLCCASCSKKFAADPAGYLKKYHEAVMSKSSGAANPAP